MSREPRRHCPATSGHASGCGQGPGVSGKSVRTHSDPGGARKFGGTGPDGLAAVSSGGRMGAGWEGPSSADRKRSRTLGVLEKADRGGLRRVKPCLNWLEVREHVLEFWQVGWSLIPTYGLETFP